MRDVLLEVVIWVKQIVDETVLVVAVDGFGEAALAQVEVGQQGAFANVGQRQRQVQSGVRLALAGNGRHSLNNLFSVLEEEGNVGMQQAESLGDHVGAVGGDDDFVVDACGGLLRYLAQHRYRGVLLHIVFRTQLDIEEVDAEHNYGRQCQSYDNCHKDYHHQARCCEAHNGRLDNFGVADGDGQVHGGLLALGQQIEVEFLLDFLLTAHFGDGLGLRGHGSNLVAGTGLLAAGLLGAHCGGTE